MPQLILTLSHNITLTRINFEEFFKRIHEVLATIPDMNVNTAHSGVIQEAFSYIGLNHPKTTKVYLQLHWMENSKRRTLKPELGKALLQVINEVITPEIRQQGLECIPRVRIAPLGDLNESYFIAPHQ